MTKKTFNYENKMLRFDLSIVTDIAPLVNGFSYVATKSRVFMFALNNEKKHFNHWEMDGVHW